MTVINVTDATLKGDVAGPTFTGNVDGSKFSGSVTYTDTTTPPVDPPPGENTGPTGGLIANFTSKPDGRFMIDGSNWLVQSAGREWSLKQLDDHTLRYEVRPGDRASYDGNNVDRVQIDGSSVQFNNDSVIKIAFRILIEPGDANTADWFVTGNLHNNDGDAGVSTSPPLALELYKDKFRVVTRNCKAGSSPSGSNVKMLVPWTQSQNFQRNQWYVFEFEVKLNQDNGYLKLKLDGEQVINYNGPLGFGYKTYWNMALYRNSGPNQIFASKVKNMTINS